MEELTAQCARWNAANPVGTEVIVRMDSGEFRRTATRSGAQILSGHTAVIWLDEMSGCYLLSRVEPAAPYDQAPPINADAAPHLFSEVDGNFFCGQCGGGMLHAIHQGDANG